MNCQQFDKIVSDVARGLLSATPPVLMDAAAREEALAHAELCAPCAARLGAEKALNAGLRALAAHDEAREAPARVEASLLAAFRQNAAAITPAATPVKTPAQEVAAPSVVSFTEAASRARMLSLRRTQWLRWAAAAAAIITLAALGLTRLPGANKQPGPAHEEQASLPTPAPTAEIHRPAPRQLEDSADEESPVNEDTRLVRRANFRAAPRPVRHARVTARSPWDEAQMTVNLGAVEVTPQAEEVATDFIPVTFGGAQTPLDGGQVVRVKMPRAALASFGLPVNAERSHEPIKADVLYGADGLARAVRFVRD
jgi:hypothetical protein